MKDVLAKVLETKEQILHDFGASVRRETFTPVACRKMMQKYLKNGTDNKDFLRVAALALIAMEHSE